MNFLRGKWIINIGGSMKTILGLAIILVFLNCNTAYIEQVITPEGATIEFDKAVFNIPKNSVKEPVLLRIDRKKTGKKAFEQGYTMTGQTFTISPETLTFDKPINFSMSITSKNIVLGAKIGSGFVPLANSVVRGESLHAQLWHAGEYYLIEKPDKYGIINHSDADNALLIVTDPYVSDYVVKFTDVLKQNSYEYPVWTYIYDTQRSIEDNAFYLADELNRLHEQYGGFRLDIVSFGIGGLVSHRYIVDTTQYLWDISSSVIAIGTPFFGSNLADTAKIRDSSSDYRFFYTDALAAYTADLIPGSVFLTWIKEHRGLPGWQRKEVKENQNFASISALQKKEGTLPEDNFGDGVVSFESTQLTPIEPSPFNLDHFQLFEDHQVQQYISEFTKLYRSFNWPWLFTRTWRTEEEFSQVVDTWEKEIKLILRSDIDFEVLLEYNRNMLISAPLNAILLTNGDNDTYPAWYLQEKRGVRQDVLIVNRNLLNMVDYVTFLQERGLPLEMSKKDIEALKHKKEGGNIITKSDQLIKRLIDNVERPFVFATTVYAPEKYGVPLTLVGQVFIIGKDGYEFAEGRYIDRSRTEQLLYHEFTYDKISSVPFDSLLFMNRFLAVNYVTPFITLFECSDKDKDYAQALKHLQQAKRFAHSEILWYILINEFKLYAETKQNEKADSVVHELLLLPNIDTKVKKDVAVTYHDVLIKPDKAIEILADCLKDDPGNKEILELIEEYQEEL
jgi:hypothetical protein